jgi:hypothetical protein
MIFNNSSCLAVLMPVILASQEVEIRRITAQSQPWQIVFEVGLEKNSSQTKTGWWTGSRYRP